MTELEVLTRRVGHALLDRGLMLTTAESCTGGWIAQTVTALAGSSAWFDRGFVTYSNIAKQEMLGVQVATLDSHGAVSEQTVQEMVVGALARSRAQVAVAVSGIAGPGGATPDKPVGTVALAWCQRGAVPVSRIMYFAGDREAVRYQAVTAALEGVLELLGAGGDGY